MGYSLAFTQSLLMMIYIAGKVEQGLYEFIPTQKMSHDLNIPPSTASMILRRLIRAGLVESREGANGGVRLAIPPEQISVLDIFRGIEQERPVQVINIQLRLTGEKPAKVLEVIGQTLEDANDAMRQSLDAVTVRDLMLKIRE